MKINDLDKLLQEGKTAEAIDMLLEELDEVAENKATEDKEPEAETPEVENKDVYNDETEPVAAEEVKEVVVEDVEPVQDKEPEELQPKMENDDVYPEEEHQEAEEVKEVVVENEEISEDVMEINPEVAEAEKDGVAGDTVAPINVEAEEEVEEPVVEEVKDAEVEETVEKTEEVIEKEIPELKTDEELTESLNNLFAFLKKLNEEEAVEAETPEVENKDVYPEEEHQEAKEVKEVVVEEVEPVQDKEPEELQPEMENKDVYNDETEPVAAEEVKEVVVENEQPEELQPEMENDDVYPEAEHKEVRDVVEIVVEAAKMCQELGVKATLDNITECAEELLEVEAETLNEFFGFKKKTPEEKAAAKKAKEEKQLEKTREKYLKKLDGKGLTGGPVQAAIGHQIGYWTDNNERNPEANRFESLLKARTSSIINNYKGKVKSASSIDDIKNEYNECCKKVSDILAELIHEEREKGLYESENVKIGDFTKKEYDADASIESSEMNGNEEEFEKYEDIQGEGSEAAKAEESVVEPKDLMKETVEYKSLKEACMLDEDYFVTDTYSIQTSEEKLNKLTEQVSLLLAREHMDPMYDELLKNSVYCKRLHEALLEKYYTEAVSRTDKMVEKKTIKRHL